MLRQRTVRGPASVSRGALLWYSQLGLPIARTEHITLIHSDAVDHDMSVDHPGVQQLGRQAGHGPATQERFYDDMKDIIKGWFVRRHRGMLYSTRSMSVATPPAAAPPPVATAPFPATIPAPPATIPAPVVIAPPPVETAPPPAAAEPLGTTPPSMEILPTKTGET